MIGGEDFRYNGITISSCGSFNTRSFIKMRKEREREKKGGVINRRDEQFDRLI